eukprot:378922-Prorocentrum_minimum.AAC.1
MAAWGPTGVCGLAGGHVRHGEAVRGHRRAGRGGGSGVRVLRAVDPKGHPLHHGGAAAAQVRNPL